MTNFKRKENNVILDYMFGNFTSLYKTYEVVL